MYQLINLQKQLNNKEECVLLLGGFDGVHLGHKKLFEEAKKYRLPIGIMSIYGGKGHSLFTQAERRNVFYNLGIHFVLEMYFENIRNLSPKEFVDRLLQDFSIKAFLCGEDFCFGFQAQGDTNLLKEYTHGCVETHSLVEYGGKKISSTEIKAAIEQGNVERANALLSQQFFLLGEVEKDRRVGSKIGFPTANIAYPKGKLPLKKGVYQTQVEIAGQTYKAITNYGARPTFDNACVLTETYLDGFHGDLYGKALKVEFVRFLREITRFADMQALKQQLETDIRRVRNND